MTLQNVELSLLIEDFSVYPRHSVNGRNVTSIHQALLAGETLPPPVVDAKSKRIVDGWHRVRASRKLLGDQGSIKVDLRSYPNELELVRDAVALNSVHGQQLSSQDQTRSAILLKKLGAPIDAIAVALRVTEKRVEKIQCHVVIVDKEEQPAKPSLWARDGEAPKDITRSQYEVHTSASGWRHRQTIKQLTKELRSGLVDLDDGETVAALRELCDGINAALGPD